MSQLLRRHAESDDLPFVIMTGDEGWFHRLDPEAQRQNME
jgi:hypothetical protein